VQLIITYAKAIIYNNYNQAYTVFHLYIL